MKIEHILLNALVERHTIQPKFHRCLHRVFGIQFEVLTIKPKR